MKRRQFIQLAGASALAIAVPSRALGQNNDAQTAAEPQRPAREPIQTLSAKDLTLIAGFSDARSCTYKTNS